MGFFVSKLLEVYESFRDSPATILMLGIDNAGKTTMLHKLKFNEVVSTIPTLGFNVETVSPCKGLTFTVWDVGGQTILRPLWRHYYHNCDGLIYVIDSNDRERLEESRDQLYATMEAHELRGVPLLVFANKQDLPHAEPLSKIVDALQLQTLKREWNVQSCSAVNGEGVFEGIQKFAATVKNFQRTKSHS